LYSLLSDIFLVLVNKDYTMFSLQNIFFKKVMEQIPFKVSVRAEQHD